MTDASVERALGRVEGQLSQILKQQEDAKTHRDKIDGQIGDMAETLDDVQSTVSDMKPVVDQIRQARMFIIAVLFVGAALISTLTLGREKLAAITRWLAG